MVRQPLIALSFLALAALPTWAASPEGDLPRKATLGVDLRMERGAVVVERIHAGSTAADGGLRSGDTIVALAGQPIPDIPRLVTAVGALAAGARVEITLLRDGQPVTRTLTLKERPRDRGDTFQVLYQHVVSRGVRLRTIVTRPHAPGRHPVLFLIPGLGAVSLDQPLDGPGAYSRILRAFAAAGYVTVRVEKPGIGDSEGGPYADTDFDTELDGLRQALIAVRGDAFVDPDQIFVFGHSMGGVFGPALAIERPVKGVAVYGTVVKTTTEYFLENWRRQAGLGGSDAAAVDSTVRDLAAALHPLLVERKTPDEVLAAAPHLRPLLARLMPDGRIDGRALPFWTQLAATNLPALWSRGAGHVLAIWGRNDFIASEGDHPLIAQIVNAARPGMAAYVALDGADHGFRKTASPEDSFRRWRSPGGEFNGEIVNVLKEWTEKIRAGR